jgi:hypothetical protein
MFRVDVSGRIQRYAAHITPFPSRTIETTTVDGMIVSIVVPFIAPPIFKVAPSGARMGALRLITEGPAGSMRLVLLGANGDTVYARNYPFLVERISASVADSVVNQRITSFERSMGAARLPAGFREAVRRKVPPFHPPYSDMLIGDDGVVWIACSTRVARSWAK